MESMQALKNRINSIGSTKKITRSMWLLASAKVQRARSRMADNRPFSEQIRLTVAEIAANAGGGNPYLTQRQTKTAAVVVISSDRGLCGGYNINVGRQMSALVAGLADTRVVTVGSRARDYCRRRRVKVTRSFMGMSENPHFDNALDIGKLVWEWYERGEVGEVYLVFTRFITLLSQTPITLKLLPLDRELLGDGWQEGSPVRCEPDEEALLGMIVPFYIYTLIYGAMLESSACELSARVTSMDAAVKNSDDILAALTLRYNQARQGAITQEITEIVSGADAMNSRKDR